MAAQVLFFFADVNGLALGDVNSDTSRLFGSRYFTPKATQYTRGGIECGNGG